MLEILETVGTYMINVLIEINDVKQMKQQLEELLKAKETY